MNERWDLHYNEMQTDIKRCLELLLPELEQVECAFKIANNYWQELTNKLREYQFTNENEEINFYKNVKPKFTGYIEFLKIMYQALLFTPTESKEIEQSFWDEEEKRLARFIERNIEFVNYFKSGNTHHDMQYFLPANYDLEKITLPKAYNIDCKFITSHDHVVADLFAQEMYHEYVLKKLSRIGFTGLNDWRIRG